MAEVTERIKEIVLEANGEVTITPDDKKSMLQSMTGSEATDKSLIPIKTTLRIDVDG